MKKRTFIFCLLVILGLAFLGGASYMDQSSYAGSPGDGSYNLSQDSLTVTADELTGYLLFTNSGGITVQLDDSLTAESCTVYLCRENDEKAILEQTLTNRDRKTRFVGLTAEERYVLKIENADGLNFTVSDSV